MRKGASLEFDSARWCRRLPRTSTEPCNHPQRSPAARHRAFSRRLLTSPASPSTLWHSSSRGRARGNWYIVHAASDKWPTDTADPQGARIRRLMAENSQLPGAPLHLSLYQVAHSRACRLTQRPWVDDELANRVSRHHPGPTDQGRPDGGIDGTAIGPAVCPLSLSSPPPCPSRPRSHRPR